MASSCQKETVVERVEVQKGNIIHSGMGAPDARVLLNFPMFLSF